MEAGLAPPTNPSPATPRFSHTQNPGVASFSIVKWPCLLSSNGPVFNYQTLHTCSTTGSLFDHQLALFSLDKNTIRQIMEKNLDLAAVPAVLVESTPLRFGRSANELLPGIGDLSWN